MNDPNEVILVIRREKAEELQRALAANSSWQKYITLLQELEAKLAEALRES